MSFFQAINGFKIIYKTVINNLYVFVKKIKTVMTFKTLISCRKINPLKFNLQKAVKRYNIQFFKWNNYDKLNCLIKKD